MPPKGRPRVTAAGTGLTARQFEERMIANLPRKGVPDAEARNWMRDIDCFEIDDGPTRRSTRRETT